MRAQLIKDELVFEPIHLTVTIETLDELIAIEREHRRIEKSSFSVRHDFKWILVVTLREQLAEQIEKFIPVYKQLEATKYD